MQQSIVVISGADSDFESEGQKLKKNQKNKINLFSNLF
jgi:hypothetical protein